MSEPLSKVKILLDSENSEGLHLVILDCESRKYMSAKIFSAEEHVKRGNERNYKSPLKNSYMLFRNDIIETWNLAKQTKKFRKYPESFKDISLLWSNLPKNGIEIYEQIYIDYKELFPKFEEFIQFSPRKNVNEGEKFEEFVNYSEALVFRSEEHQRFTSDNLPPTIKSVEKNEVVSELGTVCFFL